MLTSCALRLLLSDSFVIQRVVVLNGSRNIFSGTTATFKYHKHRNYKNSKIMLKTCDESGFAVADKKFFTSVGFDKSKLSRKEEIEIETNPVNEEYENAIKTLNTLQSNAETIRQSIKLDVKQASLEDMYKYLDRCGISMNELNKLSVVHVSGTKGKGSTCALVESILRAHNIKTGFFSSPHLVSVTERIRINGNPIAKEEFTRAFWHIYNRLEATQKKQYDMPMYFKFLTLVGFYIFLQEHVNVVILEVGIGGELDCTNVVRNTQTVGITSLGLEHTHLLGETLQKIAWQKAGIIKPNSNVFTSVKQPECLEVLQRRAAEKNAKLYVVPDYADYMQDDNSAALLSSLNDVVQLNGSLAIQLAFDWLNKRSELYALNQNYAINSTTLTDEVLRGLTECQWPGRCQFVKFFNLNIYLDGAHTVESIQVCKDWFQKNTAESSNPKVLLFNTTGERDSRKLLEILHRECKFDFACFVPNIPCGSINSKDNHSVYGIADQIKRAKTHAASWQDLPEEKHRRTHETVDNSKVYGSIMDGFVDIHQKFGSKRQIDVLITGSLHLIGATMSAMDEYRKRLETTECSYLV